MYSYYLNDFLNLNSNWTDLTHLTHIQIYFNNCIYCLKEKKSFGWKPSKLKLIHLSTIERVGQLFPQPIRKKEKKALTNKIIVRTSFCSKRVDHLYVNITVLSLSTFFTTSTPVHPRILGGHSDSPRILSLQLTFEYIYYPTRFHLPKRVHSNLGLRLQQFSRFCSECQHWFVWFTATDVTHMQRVQKLST